MCIEKKNSEDWETSQNNQATNTATPLPHARTCQVDNGDIKNKSPSPTQKRSSKVTAGRGQPPGSPSFHHKFCLTTIMEGSCLVSAGRLFHRFAPRYEKHFCPFAEGFFGNFKSVFAFQRVRELHAEFLVKRLLTYCGASPFIDL